MGSRVWRATSSGKLLVRAIHPPVTYAKLRAVRGLKDTWIPYAESLVMAGGQIRMAQYPEAVSLLLKFALACHSLQLTSSQCKAYLGAVVVWLFAQDAGEAWAVYQVCSHFYSAPAL